MSFAAADTYNLTSSRSEDVESQISGSEEARLGGRPKTMLERLHDAPPLPLTVPLGIHYTFVTLALVATGENPWIPSYFFSHIVVILVGVWAARDQQKMQPVLLYIYILFMSCVVDCIQLGSYLLTYAEITEEQHSIHRGLWIMSVCVICIHLVLKPLIAVYAFVAVLQRCPSFFSYCCCCCSRRRRRWNATTSSYTYNSMDNGQSR